MHSQRVEMLADGIFAIAMTLLVLELRVPSLPPSATPGEVARALLQAWPKFAAYAGSFFTLGILWIGHHNHFHYMRRADRPFLWINIFYLMCVGFLPYCTALLGSFIWNRTAAVMYGCSLVLAGSTLYVEWRYAAARGLLSEEATPAVVHSMGNRILIGLAGYAAAVLIAFVSPPVCLAIYVLIPLFYLRPSAIDRHLRGERVPARDVRPQPQQVE
jgi:uncharacterized membrane protein